GGALFAFGALHQEMIAQDVVLRRSQGNITREQLDEYNTALDTRNVLRRDAFIAFGLAGGFAVAAAGLYLFDDPSPSPGDVPPVARVQTVSFPLGPMGAGLGVVGRF